MPRQREYIADDGFVGFSDLCQPGDDSSFLLAGHQCVGSPPLGALRFLPAGQTGSLPESVFLEQVAALGAGFGAHAVTPKFPEIPRNRVFRLPETPKFPAAYIRTRGKSGEPGGAVKQPIASLPEESTAHE